MPQSILPDPAEVVEAILAESMVPLDGPAFDRARDEFGRAYARAFGPSLPSDWQEAHDEALIAAQEALLFTYLRETGR